MTEISYLPGEKASKKGLCVEFWVWHDAGI